MIERLKSSWYAACVVFSAEEFDYARKSDDVEEMTFWGEKTLRFGRKVLELEEKLNQGMNEGKLRRAISIFERRYNNCISTVPLELVKE
jgi:hypothetical protein